MRVRGYWVNGARGERKKIIKVSEFNPWSLGVERNIDFLCTI